MVTTAAVSVLPIITSVLCLVFLAAGVVFILK